MCQGWSRCSLSQAADGRTHPGLAEFSAPMTLHPFGPQASAESANLQARGSAHRGCRRRLRCTGDSAGARIPALVAVYIAPRTRSPRRRGGVQSPLGDRPSIAEISPQATRPEPDRQVASQRKRRCTGEASRVEWGEQPTRRVLACVAASPPGMRLACQAPAGSIRARERPGGAIPS